MGIAAKDVETVQYNDTRNVNERGVFIIRLQRNLICFVSFRTSHRRYHPKQWVLWNFLLSFKKGRAKDLAYVPDIKLRFVHLLSRSRGGLDSPGRALRRSTLDFLPLLIAGYGRGRTFALRKKLAQNIPWADAASSS